MLFAAAAASLFSQVNTKYQLALQYYQSGQYEKAADLYEDLYKDNPGSAAFYKYYYNCLIFLKEYKSAEKLARKQISRSPENSAYEVDLGYVYMQQGETARAQQHFKSVIGKLAPDRNKVISLAGAFRGIREYEFALETYLAGQNLLHDYPFSLELASIYELVGNRDKMLESYLDFLSHNPTHAEQVKSMLQKHLEEPQAHILFQRQLYKRMQAFPDQTGYVELLIWSMVQRHEFQDAFAQVMALDRRLDEGGQRIYTFGHEMLNAKQYEIALEAFRHIVDQGPSGKLYFYARQGLLTTRKSRLLDGLGYSEPDLLALEKAYYEFISSFGHHRGMAIQSWRELAELQAEHLNDPPKAILILEELVKEAGVPKSTVNEIKLDLGDYYLMSGDIWESTLLYAQVDKAMKDEPLGEAARFRNARLSYFKGEFLWAQAQLDILKAATSELISNDALQLSVFITDNLGLDTTSVPMERFALAELLLFQHNDSGAAATLDSLLVAYPGHELGDDIHYRKAGIKIKRGRFNEALDDLGHIVKYYQDGILADDALFLMAQIYEHHIHDAGQAMSLYEKIMTDHKGSTYTIPARNRYRALRGDELN